MNEARRLTIVCGECGRSCELSLGPFDALASGACPDCHHVNYASLYERLDIGLSEVCNLSCLMCRRPQESEFMAKEKVGRTLREAARVGIRAVSFSGGEPFVHPDIREILRMALEIGIEIELVTNGTLVRESDVPLLERMKCVTLSIDGPQKEHDFIRGSEGAWDKTMATLELLERSQTTWGTNTVMQWHNAGVLHDTWTEIRRRGRPHYVAFTHVEVVPETSHLLLTAEQTIDARCQVALVRAECKRDYIHWNDDPYTGEHFDLFADKSRRFRPLHGCPIPRSFIGVTNYGYYPCWHQGRGIQADGLIEALESSLCEEIIREGLERRCVGCNAANYSWSDEWLSGVLQAHEQGDYVEGVVHLNDTEREKGAIREGKRTLPMLERRSKSERVS